MLSRFKTRAGNLRFGVCRDADYVLELSLRSSAARKRRRRAMVIWVARIIFLVVLGFSSYFGMRRAFDHFFFSNPEYVVREIRLELDDVMTREDALELSGLREGVNIFSVDLVKVECAFRSLEMVRSVHIERQLPNMISVKLVSREPVAWIAPGSSRDAFVPGVGSLMVDKDGVVMKVLRLREELFHLPIIYGVDQDFFAKDELLHRDDLRKALDLLERTRSGAGGRLRIRSVDISRGWAVEVVTDQNARILLDSGGLEQQLVKVEKLLEHCEETGRVLEYANFAVKRNTPVRFAMSVDFLQQEKGSYLENSKGGRK